MPVCASSQAGCQARGRIGALLELGAERALVVHGQSATGRSVLADAIERCERSLADQHPLAVAAREAWGSLPAAGGV